jgi:hypothetical protein
MLHELLPLALHELHMPTVTVVTVLLGECGGAGRCRGGGLHGLGGEVEAQYAGERYRARTDEHETSHCFLHTSCKCCTVWCAAC